MGKGDIKTKKGKRTAGSYGVSRPKPSSLIKAKAKIAKEEKANGVTKKVVAKKVAAEKAPKEIKAKVEKTEKVKAEKAETTEAATPSKKKATKKSEE